MKNSSGSVNYIKDLPKTINMNKPPETIIKLTILTCRECPFLETKNQWSSDGWDRMEDWFCSKSNQKIAGAVEWHEENKIPVPEWCPIKTNQ